MWHQAVLVGEVDKDVEVSVKALADDAHERLPLLVGHVRRGLCHAAADKALGEQLLERDRALGGEYEQLVVELESAPAHYVAQLAP